MRFFVDLPLDRVLDQFTAAAQGKFLLDVCLVGFNGLHAEVKFFGDFAGGAAFADQAKDFQFPIGERGDAGLDHMGAPPMYCCSILLDMRSLR